MLRCQDVPAVHLLSSANNTNILLKLYKVSYSGIVTKKTLQEKKNKNEESKQDHAPTAINSCPFLSNTKSRTCNKSCLNTNDVSKHHIILLKK